MFHLVTHAFFKALMFLGSGSVIHAMQEEQDIRKMGGLRKAMPITHLTFLMGWLAIIGMPPFAGFFSKDEILWMAYHSPMGHWSLWALGAMGATLTAFYMTRLVSLTFWGKSRVEKGTHPHESPWMMTSPLILLAVLSAVGGWIGIPHVIGEILPGHPENFFSAWLSSVIKPIPNLAAGEPVQEWILMGTSVGLALASAVVAWQLYIKNPTIPEKTAKALRGFYRLVSQKYLVDELYNKVFVQPVVRVSKNTWHFVDVNFVDRITYWIADLMVGGGMLMRTVQTGNMQQYAMYIGFGLVAILSIVIMRS